MAAGQSEVPRARTLRYGKLDELAPKQKRRS